jgi:hypothetical protein
MTQEDEQQRSENRETAEEKCWRWRTLALGQLGYSLNLTLTFAIAALGFCFALLRDESFHPSGCTKCAFIAALVFLTLSSLLGYSCVLSRVKDFRGTARRACNHAEKPTQDELRDLDKRVLSLVDWQVYTFGGGVTSLALTLLLHYGHKLL